jgi:pimeloyl-ACP methyl ester carboxylesterase
MCRGHFIGYDESYAVSDESISKKRPAVYEKIKRQDPVLLLSGFGVGSFHQNRLTRELLKLESSRVIYCMDYLGQGRSWPVDCDDGDSVNEAGLIYSADT